MSLAMETPFIHPAPRPLIPTRSAPLPYPVEALGPILGPFVEAVVESTRCADPTAAQSALAVASLAAQAHADVATPAGQIKPLSLFFLTVALSGERKSAADAYALAPIREVEAAERDRYKTEHRDHLNSLEAWEAQRVHIKRAKGDRDEKKRCLDALGQKPHPPLRPERTLDDTTAEGLIKTWEDCHGARGLFTAEGAKVIAGHSMSAEARLRTAATYCGLWDEGRAERIRAGDGFLSLRGRRLAVHLMAQPGVAQLLIGAADLEDQGLTARFLICEAPEMAGTRFFKPPAARGDPRFVAFASAIRGLLTMAPDTWDGRNELKPRVLRFTDKAREVWIALHDHIEARLGTAGELGGVKPFGSKLAEHAARLAGVLTLMDDPQALTIEAATIERAADLANYYAAESVRLNREMRLDPHLAEAEKLRLWLADWAEPLISLPDVESLGPNPLRPKAIAERCVETLVQYGWLIPEGRAEVGGKPRRETWRIVRERSRP